MTGPIVVAQAKALAQPGLGRAAVRGALAHARVGLNGLVDGIDDREGLARHHGPDTAATQGYGRQRFCQQ